MGSHGDKIKPCLNLSRWLIRKESYTLRGHCIVVILWLKKKAKKFDYISIFIPRVVYLDGGGHGDFINDTHE